MSRIIYSNGRADIDSLYKIRNDKWNAKHIAQNRANIWHINRIQFVIQRND